MEANICGQPNGGFPGVKGGEVLWMEGTASSEEQFEAWSVRWSKRDKAGIA